MDAAQSSVVNICFTGGRRKQAKAADEQPLSLLDSGCNTSISGEIDDFEDVDFEEMIPVTGVAGEAVLGDGTAFPAYRDLFRGDNLGLKYGLYAPRLPMARIIALGDLTRTGYVITFDSAGCIVKNRHGRGGRIFRENGLDYLRFGIKKDLNWVPRRHPKRAAERRWRHDDDPGSVLYVAAAEDGMELVHFPPLPQEPALAAVEESPEEEAGLEPGQEWSMDLTKGPIDPANPVLDAPDPRSLEESLKEAKEAGVSDAAVKTPGNAPSPPDPHTHTRATHNTLKKLEQDLVAHKNLGHLSHPGLPGIGKSCKECAMSKGGRSSVNKIRPEEYNIHEPMEQINVDFLPPLGSIYGKSLKSCAASTKNH